MYDTSIIDVYEELVKIMTDTQAHPEGFLESSTDAPKLTDWANAPTVDDLKQDLTDAQSDHTGQVAKIKGYLDQLNITGTAKIAKVTGRSAVQPRLIRKHAEWRYAALSEPFLSTDNIFNVEPVTFEDGKSAFQNALVLNNQFNTKLNKVEFIDSYVRTAVDEGTVIVRVGWEFEEDTQLVEQDQYEFLPASSQQEMMELQGWMQQAQQDPITFQNHTEDHIQQAVAMSQQAGQPIFPVFIETIEVEETVTTKNQPTLEICDYRNVVIDPSCKGDTTKAEFAIYSFETSKSALIKAGNYKNIDKINVPSNSADTNPHYSSDEESSFKFKDTARAKVVAHEYWGWWDIDDTGTTKPIVATWVGDVMIRLEENPFPDRAIPFVTVQYLPVRNDTYGEPDGSLLKENQQIVGAVTRGAIDSMARSAVAQQGMRKDALDPINKRKYHAGKDYEFNPNVDPRAAVIEHRYPELPNSVGAMLQMQTLDADNMTGVRAFGATASSAGTTATADRGTLDAASKRETGILRRLSKGMELIARKIIAMNGEWLSEEEVIRVTNEEFVTISRDDLAGKFDLRLGISTAEEDDAKAKELAFMLQTMGNNLDFGMVKLVLKDIARLRKMPELAKAIETFEPQPDPMAEQMKQLEMAKMQAEINEINARAQELQSKAQLNMANAGNKQSDTDKKDLDFVQEESGVSHSREMEKQGAQARANMGLEVVKASLNKKEPAPTK